MRSFTIAALLLSTAGPRAWGQDPPDPLADLPLDYWVSILYPKITATPRNGLAVGGYVAFMQPLREDQWEAPPPYRILASFDGQLYTSGSRFLKADLRAPAWRAGWRFGVTLMARRRAHDNYFGVGNGSVHDDDLETDAQPNFYRAHRTQFLARAEVQRVAVGPVRLLAGLHVERWRLGTPEGPSVLANDRVTRDPTIGTGTLEVAGRVGLVIDTRDDEVAPSRGILLEGIVGRADASVAGDVTYTRTTVSARAFVSPTMRVTLAARAMGQQLAGDVPTGTYYLIEASDRPYTGLGGGSSHRALPNHRLLGRHKLLGSFETRYLVFGVPPVRVSLMGFVDAGRVFETEDFALTTRGLKVGGGGGMMLQIGRAALAGFTLGTGPDGVVGQFHTRWSF